MFRVLPLPSVQKRFQLVSKFRVLLELYQQRLEIQLRFFRLGRIELLLNFSHIWIGVKSHLETLSVDLALFVKNMSIYLCDHLCLCMTGIALGRFNVAVIQLQLIGCAAVSQ